MLHTLWPRGAGRTEVVCEWLFEPETMEREGFDPTDAVEFWDLVNRQDWHVCELSQLGLGSAGYTPGRYTEVESHGPRLRPHGRRGLPEMSRERILDAAINRIAADGIDGVRIARIAMDARVSTALVHYHFATREALLAEALVALVRPRRRHPHRGTGERLRDMIEQCLPLPGEQEQDWVLWVELWLRAVRHPELRPTAAQLYARMHEWFREAIEEELPDADADATADRLLALIDGYGVRALLGDPGDAARAGARGDLGEPLRPSRRRSRFPEWRFGEPHEPTAVERARAPAGHPDRGRGGHLRARRPEHADQRRRRARRHERARRPLLVPVQGRAAGRGAHVLRRPLLRRADRGARRRWAAPATGSPG